jgi:hypothetical protein
MKRFFCLIMVVAGIATAQTNITTSTVNGTWTLAGSPYIVQNEITVQANDILVIQPGVVVKFMPATRMEVFGQLIASGAGNNPITFEANDTSGWHDEMVLAGGWNGIHFHPYGGTGSDNSIINYCFLQDAKYGYATIMNYMYPISIERGLKVHNSTFRHNQTFSGMVGSGATLWAQLYISTDTLDIDKCVFTENISFSSVISVTSHIGFTNVTNTHIHHNEKGSGVTGLSVNMLIENNEIDHNNTMYDSAPLYITADNVIIRGNEIHHNTSPDHGGMNCNYGNITVENNFIHNNNQTSASCGFTEGAGGINLTCFGSDINQAFFIVRNNIIVNNYSAFGGGGINVYNAIACITNNHIINNYTPNRGQAILITHPDSRVYMRNNLFYNQSSPGNIESADMIHVYNGSGIWFNYNFITSNYSEIVRTMFSYTLYGDTMHNVIGTNPGLVSNTTDNNYLTDADGINFDITSGSVCINAGDTVGAFSSNIDYVGNNRVMGIVDIGAYEHNSGEQSGVEDLIVKNDLTVFPNPVESYSTFMIFLPETTGKLSIFDINGKVVYEQATSSDQWLVNLGEQKGMFFIRFNGSTHATGKVIVQ